MKNLDLLLVNSGGTNKKVYQNLSEDYAAIEPPFWAALTAGFIKKKGFDVRILDANVENLSIYETAEAIKQYKPNLVNIVAYGQQPAASTQLMTSIGQLCKEIKKIDSNQKIILSGLHPTALPFRTMNEEMCDYVAEGEGFYTILGLLQKNSLDQVPGLWRKNEFGEILNNPRAKNIENLTLEMGEVAWDLLPSFKKYKAHNWHCLQNLDSREGYASISTSLGCPHKCKFCSINATFGEHRVRFWEPNWVLKQIDYLADKGVKNLKIIDELFILNPNHFLPIAEGLIERDSKINIWAYGRVDSIKEEHLEKLKKAGFNWLALGIESGNKEVRKNVSKGKFGQTDITYVTKTITNNGINILGNYMFGLPDDTLKSMGQTLDLAMELNCDFANFYSVMAYPGSKLYEEAFNAGIKMPQTWQGFSQHSYDCLPLANKNLKSEEILKFRDRAFKTYYTNPKYLKSIESKFGLKAKKHIEAMASFELKRRILGQ